MTVTSRSTDQPLHVSLGVSSQQLLEIYRLMVLSRAICDRAWQLQRSGKAGFVVTSEGHEAVQVASVCALQRGKDFFSPYYRDLAVVIAAGVLPRDMFLHILGRGADPSSGGRQLPGHYSDQTLGIFPVSTVVATQIPRAAGIALANKIRGSDAVVACYFGDGATSEGDCHEGMNFAGVHRLPVIFICENNGYAISVPVSKQAAIPDLSARAAGYGFPGETIDGNDVLAVFEAVGRAARRARGGEGPTFIEAKTYRLMPHTSNDDPGRYRGKGEEAEWRLKDPIVRFRKYLFDCKVLDASAEEDLRRSIAQNIDEATRVAEASPLPTPEDALQHVYKEQGQGPGVKGQA